MMETHELKSIADRSRISEPMPVVFVGHGNPMNAIEENEFVAGWRTMAQALPKPAAILCVSAHWETRGTFVTAMTKPRTIHDFGGFPRRLYEVEYPAPGDPELAQAIAKGISKTNVEPDDSWGLDHGCWSVLKHFYPDADVPIVQMSLDAGLAPKAHYELAKELASLRTKNILIVGSGNMVHNLRLAAWDRIGEIGYAYDWTLEAAGKMKRLIRDGDHRSLIDYESQGREFNLAVPTPEHYLPLLYVLALQGENEELRFYNDLPVGGSLTMTSLTIGHS